jgi:hypothetical protein
LFLWQSILLLRKLAISRVWSLCETMQDEYMTFHAIPGSCLAILFSQEI